MNSFMGNPLAVIMIIIMIILILIIGLLAHLLLGAAGLYVENLKQKKASEKKTSSAPAALMFAGLVLSTLSAAAQDAKTALSTIGGMKASTFYIMTAIIFLEIIVILGLLINVRILMAREKKSSELAPVVATPGSLTRWWNKFNRFKPLQEEVQIDLGHDYDGIRELDNRLPPWWLYGFYLTVVFAGVYLWRFHVSHTGLSSQQEFQYAMAVAAEQKEVYLKNAAAKVDETTVKMLSAAADLQSGQTIFQSSCAPCHGKAGEGTVGPNLTDEYWLYGGSIKDIFKTIKYGVPEKGMKSWKEDFSPAQIAQISSYIKSLGGTHPANAKDKQGELYNEPASQDSTAVKTVAAVENK
jgi:cytochrome c oxidase cbb3-type subunit III